jgi:hypothetical protein
LERAAMAYTDLRALRKAVQERRIVFSDRAAQRLGEKGILSSHALAVIEIGNLVEEPPDELQYAKSLSVAAVNDDVDVPATVCCRCGEAWLGPDVMELIEQVIQQKPEPKRFHQVPVFSLNEF